MGNIIIIIKHIQFKLKSLFLNWTIQKMGLNVRMGLNRRTGLNAFYWAFSSETHLFQWRSVKKIF